MRVCTLQNNQLHVLSETSQYQNWKK